MSKIVTLFDNIFKLIGVTYLFLTIAAFIDLKIFYAQFGIAINEYIGVSEIMFAALDQMLLVLFALMIQLGIWLSLFRDLFDYDQEESMKDGEPRPKAYHDETIHRSLKNKTLTGFWLTIIVGALVFGILSSIFPNTKFLTSIRDFFLLNYWMAMCLYMMWLQTTRILWKAWKTKGNSSKAIITLVVFISVLLLSIWVKNLFLFKRIYKKGNSKQIEIILNDSSMIRATDTIRYVGHTENYFFYWNKFTSEVSVYRVSDIKRINLK